MLSIKKLADAIYNDINSGLIGFHLNMSMSKEQLEEEVVLTRLAIIKEHQLKGILPTTDLLVSLNCIPVDCDTLDKCRCSEITCGKPIAHFQIPQIIFDFGLKTSIKYLGASDRLHPYLVYTNSLDKVNLYLKYRKRGKNKPWVYIDMAPNSEGLLDCYIFKAPLVKQVSITAIFKDPRQFEDFQCECENTVVDNNLSFIDTIIKDRLTLLKIKYYRLLAAPTLPNTLEYVAG